MKAKVEFIPNHNVTPCWTCEGTGKVDGKICHTCEGTGKWIDTSYWLVHTNEKGQKQAFQVDMPK